MTNQRNDVIDEDMARPLRIEYEGAFYHVMNRGLERREILQEERDYEKFLELLEDTHQQYHFKVHSYCLMPNHYHLYLETPQGDLSRGMRHIDGIYTQVFNKRRRRVGPLFQGRYKAIVVEKESYSLEISRYIHLNPVKAKMVERPEQWKWSSYRMFLGKEKKREFLETDWLLGQFAKKGMRARGLFHQFTLEGLKESWEPGKEKQGCVLGGMDFCNWVRHEFLEEKEDGEIPELRQWQKKASLEEIEEVISKLSETETRIKKKLRIYAMRKYGGLSLKEIGEKMGGVSYSGVSRVVERLETEMEKNLRVRRLVEQLKGKMSNVQT